MAKRALRRQSGSQVKSVPTVLRCGDPVMVIAGGNKKKRPLKGQVAKITRFVGSAGDRVILEGLNSFVRHTKAKSASQESGRFPVQLSVHISNVMYYSDSAKRPVRLAKKVRSDGVRVRGYKDPVSKDFVEV